jgi:drug/metabolite transporter (DMT)-like permease
MGWLNPGLYYLVLFAAYDQLPAQEAMAINYSWGITLALIAAPLLRQRLTPGALLAACISYSGIVVIATRGSPLSLDFAQPLGVGLALLSTLLWSLYWVINTRLSVDPEVNLFLNFSGALPLLLGLLWWSGTPLPIVWQGWAGGLYVGLFEMGLAFVLWMGAMKATTSTLRISSLIFLSPPLSLILIWMIAGEPVKAYTLIGLILILFGLWLQRRAEV